MAIELCNIHRHSLCSWGAHMGFYISRLETTSLVCELSVALPAEGRCVLVRGHEVEQRRTGAIQQGLPQKGAPHEFRLLQNMPRLQPGPFPIGCESLQCTTEMMNLPAAQLGSHLSLTCYDHGYSWRKLALCISISMHRQGCAFLSAI